MCETKLFRCYLYLSEMAGMGLGSSKRASENLGVSKTTLGTWGKTVRENNGEVPVREPSDYVNDGPTLWRIFWILTRWTEM